MDLLNYYKVTGIFEKDEETVKTGNPASTNLMDKRIGVMGNIQDFTGRSLILYHDETYTSTSQVERVTYLPDNVIKVVTRNTVYQFEAN